MKIQRPGLEALVRTDLSLMRRVAAIVHHNSWLQRFDLPSLVREFSFILQDELLYTLEAHNAETLSKEMADYPEMLFQQIYWPLHFAACADHRLDPRRENHRHAGAGCRRHRPPRAGRDAGQ